MLSSGSRTLASLLFASSSIALSIPLESASRAAGNASFVDFDFVKSAGNRNVEPEIICDAAEYGYGGLDLNLGRYVFQGTLHPVVCPFFNHGIYAENDSL